MSYINIEEFLKNPVKSSDLDDIGLVITNFMWSSYPDEETAEQAINDVKSIKRNEIIKWYDEYPEARVRVRPFAVNDLCRETGYGVSKREPEKFAACGATIVLKKFPDSDIHLLTSYPVKMNQMTDESKNTQYDWMLCLLTYFLDDIHSEYRNDYNTILRFMEDQSQEHLEYTIAQAQELLALPIEEFPTEWVIDCSNGGRTVNKDETQREWIKWMLKRFKKGAAATGKWWVHDVLRRYDSHR